jgi:hypothetical protein
MCEYLALISPIGQSSPPAESGLRDFVIVNDPSDPVKTLRVLTGHACGFDRAARKPCKSAEVEYHEPVGLYVYPYSGEMVRFITRTVDVLVTPDHKMWVRRLTPLRPTLVVLEASGGYEGVIAATLAEAGLPVAIVNPRQIRKFAGAIGRLAKTDAIDAAVIAHFAQAVRPTARPLPDDLAIRLAELMARRRQLVVMINAEKQRLAKAQDRIAQRSFKALLKSLEAERARIDRAIDKLIEASPLWCAQQDLLKSVPGIGDVVPAP